MTAHKRPNAFFECRAEETAQEGQGIIIADLQRAVKTFISERSQPTSAERLQQGRVAHVHAPLSYRVAADQIFSDCPGEERGALRYDGNVGAHLCIH